MHLFLAAILLSCCPLQKIDRELCCLKNCYVALMNRAELDEDIAERIQYYDVLYARVLFCRVARYRQRACCAKTVYCRLLKLRESCLDPSLSVDFHAVSTSETDE